MYVYLSQDLPVHSRIPQFALKQCSYNYPNRPIHLKKNKDFGEKCDKIVNSTMIYLVTLVGLPTSVVCTTVQFHHNRATDDLLKEITRRLLTTHFT